jgi:hypothetical protein
MLIIIVDCARHALTDFQVKIVFTLSLPHPILPILPKEQHVLDTYAGKQQPSAATDV